jgi:hypothetical protein
VVPLFGGVDFPHETKVIPASKMTDKAATALFKRETPKSMMDKDLYAKPRIITNPFAP